MTGTRYFMTALMAGALAASPAALAQNNASPSTGAQAQAGASANVNSPTSIDPVTGAIRSTGEAESSIHSSLGSTTGAIGGMTSGALNRAARTTHGTLSTVPNSGTMNPEVEAGVNADIEGSSVTGTHPDGNALGSSGTSTSMGAAGGVDLSVGGGGAR